MFAIPRGRLVVAALGLSASVAVAQGPFTYGPVAGCAVGHCAAANHGTYGPALFAANPLSKHFAIPGPNEPACVGRSSYPLSDWHYIRQFCGPTLQPGTCYGYNPTKWRKWEDHCPGDPAVAAAVPAPSPLIVAPTGPTTPVTPTTPSDPLPTPKEDKKDDKPKVDPVTPPKVPLIPKDAGGSSAPLPAIPAAPKAPPVPMPSEPGKISTTEALTPMPPSAVVPPSPEPRVVVPPTGK